MNKKFLIAVVAVVVLAGGFYWYSNKDAAYSPTPTSDNVDRTNPIDVKSVVTYTDEGYSPSTITVAIGETVVFTNNSSMEMWPASAMHPTHAVYPTTGGCLGSTFDACVGIAPGGSWAFKFDVAGSWNYHDHLSPTKYGKVVVQ